MLRGEVTLLDGRAFELEGSNDVDDQNRGLFVRGAAGAMTFVAWEDVDTVRFDSR